MTMSERKNKFHKPPSLFERILQTMLSAYEREGLCGDFEEIYNDYIEEKGNIKAKLWYLAQILAYFPRFISNTIYWRMIMINNYLKIAVRNLKKHKTHSIINVLGLSIGLACCILIFLFVQDELSYDRYHKNAKQIYRLAFTEDRGYKTVNFPISSGGIGPALIKEVPEVMNVVRFRGVYDELVSCGEKHFYEKNIFYADASVFDVFSFNLIKGNPKVALAEPNTVVISEEVAQKYFGKDDPIGKVLNFGNQDFKVTGILEKIPHNSHFRFDLLASMSTLENISDEWRSSSCYTYLLLQKDYPYSELEKKFPEFFAKYKSKNDERKFYLQPLTKIHLHSNLEREIEHNSDITYVYILSFVAIFVLSLACINFMNLNTARSANRSKEVGLRKVMGANRKDLIKQFLSESIFLTLIAFLLALVLVELFLPVFSRLADKKLGLGYLNNFWVFLGTIGFVFLIGVFSGSYPAFFISAFQPVRVLKETLKAGSKSSQFRKILVVIQFSLSIIMIIGTIVIRNQLDYIQNKNLGFDKEHVIVVRIDEGEIQKKYYSLKNDLLQNPNILNVSASTAVPSETINPDPFVPEGESDENYILMGNIVVDFDFIKTIGMEVIQGRDFSKDISTDAAGAFILNEEAVKKFAWESPVGKKLGFPRSLKNEVIGVVKNFHYLSKHQRINPLVISLVPNREVFFQKILIKTNPENIKGTISFITKKWKEFSPGRPLNYYFLDERYDEMYRKEEKLGEVFKYFTLFAIFIACLGLFGLASFTAEQRTKEIGIRKVLGASVPGIAGLLSKDFATCVLLANIIAWPAAYYFMNEWLQNFAYRINLSVWPFIISGLAALGIALLTVSYQSIKAATANPADSLRYE